MIVALHGFLGCPSDWQALGMDNLQAIAINRLTEWTTMEEWATAFNYLIASQAYTEKPILMGYSLGGRLALHALIQQSDYWQAGIIISAHPGLAAKEDRQKRLQEDKEWASRFETEQWNTLMKAWNSRAALASGHFQFERKEEDYSRKDLASLLSRTSLAKQADLQELIEQLPMPLLWITGEKDAAYVKLAECLSFAHPFSKWKNIAHAGHRVPWEQPALFKQAIQSFLMHQNLAV